jgi:hypothetical protein
MHDEHILTYCGRVELSILLHRRKGARISFSDQNRSPCKYGILDKLKYYIYLKDMFVRILIEWVNDELHSERIIVQDIEEDLYDGQVSGTRVPRRLSRYQVADPVHRVPSLGLTSQAKPDPHDMLEGKNEYLPTFKSSRKLNVSFLETKPVRKKVLPVLEKTTNTFPNLLKFTVCSPLLEVTIAITRRNFYFLEGGWGSIGFKIRCGIFKIRFLRVRKRRKVTN